VNVNRSREIREFLVSRRARITPEQAGLPLYGANRRVKGLRREEVAMLAGVSVDYYTRLERGNLAGASETVLVALARALQLDEAEQAHLFDLARAANAHPRVATRTTRGCPTSSVSCRPAASCSARSGRPTTCCCTARAARACTTRSPVTWT
jgi:transcriptional regulator with XRE-family HTH domain